MNATRARRWSWSRTACFTNAHGSSLLQDNVSALDIQLSSVQAVLEDAFLVALAAYFQEGILRKV